VLKHSNQRRSHPVFPLPRVIPFCCLVHTMSRESSAPSAKADIQDEKQEKTGVTEDEYDASSSEIDLLTYHERNAGSLVVDPEYVPILLNRELTTELCARSRTGRQESSSGNASRVSSSSHRTGRRCCGRNLQTTLRTLRMCVSILRRPSPKAARFTIPPVE